MREPNKSHLSWREGEREGGREEGREGGRETEEERQREGNEERRDERKKGRSMERGREGEGSRETDCKFKEAYKKHQETVAVLRPQTAYYSCNKQEEWARILTS